MKNSLFSTIAACATLLVALAGNEAQAQAPATYDLRAVTLGNGTTQAWVPAIQNQGTAEDCWTFATATAIDSYLLMSGTFASSPTPPTIQTSSWHLSTHNGAPDQLVATEAFNNNSNWGDSQVYQALGYLTRGSGTWQIPNHPVANSGNYISTMSGGPVLDSAPVTPSNAFPQSITNWQPQDPTHPNGYPPNLAPLIPPAGQPTAFKVTSMAIYDQGFGGNANLPPPSGSVTLNGTLYPTYTYASGAADNQVKAVKNAIINNGAVTTFMNTYGDFIASGGPVSTVNYYNNTTATAYSDHAVTIIGWSDTYQMTDPHTSATTTGAWLVQNSWGSGSTWLNSDGTFWAAYDDAVIGRSGVSSYRLKPMGNYAQTVLQNELGPMDYFGNYDPNNSNPNQLSTPSGFATLAANKAASILTPTENSTLLALGIATQTGNVTVNVQIYDSWNNGPSNLLSQQSFFLANMGYGQFDLANPISLTASDPIVVQLTYVDAQGNPVANALPITVGGSGINGYDHVTGNLSFYSSNQTWTDMASLDYSNYYSASNEYPATMHGGILFLKGITAIPEPSPALLLLAVGLGATCIGVLRRTPQHK